MRNEKLKTESKPLIKLSGSVWKDKLIAVKAARARIAILTEGAEDSESMASWKRTINQYGRVALKEPMDIATGISILVVPSANLTGDAFLGSDKRDLELSSWWLTRSYEERMTPTIYTGKSGLIWAEVRSPSTCFKMKEKGFIPLFKADNTERGPNSKADFFVPGGNFYGIRRFCVPKGAEILYTTPISCISGSGVHVEEFVLGFKAGNVIVLLFNPEQLTQKEDSIFFSETHCRFGSETFMDAIYSLIAQTQKSKNDNNKA